MYMSRSPSPGVQEAKSPATESVRPGCGTRWRFPTALGAEDEMDLLNFDPRCLQKNCGHILCISNLFAPRWTRLSDTFHWMSPPQSYKAAQASKRSAGVVSPHHPAWPEGIPENRWRAEWPGGTGSGAAKWVHPLGNRAWIHVWWYILTLLNHNSRKMHSEYLIYNTIVK